MHTAGYNHRVTANRKFILFVVAVSAFSSLILLLYRNIKDVENEAAVGLLRALMAISTTRLLALTPGMFSLVYSLVATMFFIKVCDVRELDTVRCRDNDVGPVRKAPSSLFTMAISPGTVALVACGLLHSLRIG